MYGFQTYQKPSECGYKEILVRICCQLLGYWHLNKKLYFFGVQKKDTWHSKCIKQIQQALPMDDCCVTMASANYKHSISG